MRVCNVCMLSYVMHVRYLCTFGKYVSVLMLCMYVVQVRHALYVCIQKWVFHICV